MRSPASSSPAEKSDHGRMVARIEIKGEVCWRLYATEQGSWVITWQGPDSHEGFESSHTTPREAKDAWGECVRTWNALRENRAPGAVSVQWQDKDYMDALCKM